MTALVLLVIVTLVVTIVAASEQRRMRARLAESEAARSALVDKYVIETSRLKTRIHVLTAHPQAPEENPVNKNNPLPLAAEGLQHPDGNTDKEDYMGNVANPIDTIPAVRALVDAIGEGIPSASRIFKVDERDLRRMVNDGEGRPTMGRLVRWSKASLKAVGIGLELHVSSKGDLEYTIVNMRKA